MRYSAWIAPIVPIVFSSRKMVDSEDRVPHFLFTTPGSRVVARGVPP
jgi:hypothetical protein